MASKFLPGMKNVLEVLNQMWDAFAAGPYNSLPLTGGVMSGPLANTDVIYSTKSLYARSVDGVTRTTMHAPVNAVDNTVANVNPAISLGVSGVLGQAFEGAFVLATSSGAGSLYKEGYTLRFRASDASTGSPSTPDLLVVRGSGHVEVPGVLSIGNVGSSVIPSTDNTKNVGSSSLAFSTVYARTGAINTSDARLKCDFRDLTSAEVAAARDIARVIGVYRWRDAIDCKGEAAREHIGPTVQRAIEIMQAHGLEPFNYGFICHDTWEQETVEHPAIEARPAIAATEAASAVLDALGNVVTPAVVGSPGFPAIEARDAYTEVTLEAGDRYAFRYDELAMFIAAGQEARLAALEAA
ncbi:tail fiber domain-containing protein [Janthinobacterium sp.]|uniref:tail fiber domain-containing protein n=1 Tax=Janthinobacterium sp. TaxID=1871054 RepID=UPI0025C038BF|nr:tail fiber domain-containing protein [Janthinobacterium sp.]NBV20057.1 tail fiber domain-containing protein [Janthinobacterium sp.]